MLEKYTKHGYFTLHSGKKSDTFYDIQEMMVNELDYLLSEIPKTYDTYIGIVPVGAVIAGCLQYKMKNELGYRANFAIINKEYELKGEIYGRCLLIDDVCTTENTFENAMRSVYDNLSGSWGDIDLFCIVDRRDKYNQLFDIKSIFKV